MSTDETELNRLQAIIRALRKELLDATVQAETWKACTEAERKENARLVRLIDETKQANSSNNVLGSVESSG